MMSFLRFAPMLSARRALLAGAGRATLSAGAVLMLAGGGAALLPRGAAAATKEDDVRILNTAIAAEHEAVAAYGVGAKSGLLKKPTLALAVQFQGHHKAHIDALAKAVRAMGGTPADAKAKYDFPVAQLKNEADVLRFAAQLEKCAVSAYLGAVPLFLDRNLAKAAASILGDEAMHWAVLRQALGENPVPAAFVD
jgi:rubrerythrin